MRGGAMMATSVVLMLVGFAGGYGVRELVSRRRRAAAKRQHLERLARRDLLTR